ncbi:MAG: hypothetical protein J7L39_02415 [Candidatus Aenigmarchaeota archaeon]|nr:hypothetical protein [Candidatus Aenigmarchaeota archaeon]
MEAIAPYTLFLIILMFALFVFALIILSGWLNISIPFISDLICANARMRYCEEWTIKEDQPIWEGPENCPKPKWEECKPNSKES